jgi:conjugal transfer mating pair stabilization protein TraN
VYSADSCYNYYLRVVDQPCNKNLVVNVSWSCNAGATGPYTDGAGNHYCVRSHTEYTCYWAGYQETLTWINGDPYCQHPSSRPADDTITQVQESAIQTNNTWACNTGATGPYVDANGNHYCTRPQDHYSCKTGESMFPDPANLGKYVCIQTISRVADQYSVDVQEAAVSTVNEYWDGGCSGYESRVPPGMLPPDGQDPATGSQLNSTGSVDKCERTTSVCSDASPITRVIDTVPVTNSCWQYANTFSCVNPNSQPSDCTQPSFAQCSNVGAPVCIDWDQQDPQICTATQQNLSCPAGNTTQTTNTVNCAGQTYTDPSGQQWGTSHTPDTSFGTSVAFLEAAREGGVYMGGTPANLELFKGFGESCVKKLFGLVNCCAKSGGINIAAFSDASLAMSAMGAAGNALASTYTYNALYSAQAPMYVMNGFTELFGMGGSSAFAGFLAGDVSTVSLLAEVVPGPWTIAILVIQYSGVLSCPQNQQITSIKRGGGLCVDTGEYCSKKLKWIRTCLERTQTSCCFNSKLAKAINVQGKAQLGQGFNCSGFTPQDFSHLDLSKMDFSDFLQDVHAQAVNVSATAAHTNPANCYYGPNGKCN